MCIIIASKNGQIPNRHIYWGMVNNPDGWGFTYAEGGEVIVKKGLDFDEFWKEWDARPKDVPVIWHARIGTHGKLNINNCHPFDVPGHKIAVAHNGIIRPCVRERSRYSDTWHFVHDVLAEMPEDFLSNDAIRNLIANYIGYSKLAFIDGTGKISIINRQYGISFKGRWYSNESFRPKKQKQQKSADSCFVVPGMQGDEDAIELQRFFNFHVK